VDIQLLSFPPKSDREIQRAARLVADALAEHGAHVAADVAGKEDVDVTDLVRHYRRAWRRRSPDVIHAIGVDAAQVALAATREIPVVVSFDAESPDSVREGRLARRADGLLVASSAERRAWIASGVPADRVHTWHLPTHVADDDAVTPADGAIVVTDARGHDLELMKRAARGWSGTRLVVLPDSGADDDKRLPHASVAVATRPSRRGGLAARAASHGVPSIVLDRGVSTDQVVDGASGLTLRADADEHELAGAICRLLRNRLLCRGFGMAALLRVKATRNAGLAAERALAAYSATLVRREQPATDECAEEAAAPLPEHRQRLTVEHLDLAHALARRYDGRGQSLEDLVQVANLGLVQAARRYDPERGSSFSAFAVPTILGELKRYFRDQAWAVRVPRPVQEAALEVDAVARETEGRDGSLPTTDDLAKSVKMSRGEVREAQQARAEALSHASLNRRVDDDEGSHEIGDAIGVTDDGYETVEARAAVQEALASLSDREREVVAMRFYGEHTQAEIAQRLGVSQVQVSRLLRRTIDALRDELTTESG
jgi:RNA polymerase sigma-B factor